ncbi:nonribosomal peptide synthetase ftmA [Aspergillus affinis]|uniref:nonribosomal peptide synthetase ftmA n=1 Tax=Aspergillus affinis TaxID=1070780 RepID=UPI0022FE20D5|nr:non-ribosomal peptide synthetase [Aspergillus affinis]KAI9043895.1 non-ribosomal peptide synthetase [Aspergillus affinis]
MVSSKNNGLRETAGIPRLKLAVRTRRQSLTTRAVSLPPFHPKETSFGCTNAHPPLIAQVPKTWDVCVHDVIRERCQETPGSPAVIAWDGAFTYGELDELSDRIASALMQAGVTPENFVPICMDKSRWTTVAVLGVIKSGAAFALLDPSYPLARLQTICQDLASDIILSCAARREVCMHLANVIVVEHLSQAWYPNLQTYRPSLTVQPGNALYVAFTSGSTGKPKGVVIEHKAYSSGAKAHIQQFGIDQNSRVLQFASYAFDVSVMETLSTLMAGACLCVLGDCQRTDTTLFTDTLKRLQATHALLTPSFARAVSWDGVGRHFTTLILGGEEMRASDAVTYARLGIRLMNAYGPAECAVNATVQVGVQPGDKLSCIGHPTGAVAWVTDPDNPERLMPPGSMGELLLEGPIVGRGYLNNPEATKRAFIDPPEWLRAARTLPAEDSSHKLYRTGDLVVQERDGALSLLGRKEGQVKIRGQRVELSEIEQHIYQLLPRPTEVVVEKVTTLSDQRDSLVAFVLQRGKTDETTGKSSPLFLAPQPAVLQVFGAAQSQLQERLPSYMNPSVFIPLARVPVTPSGKVDRAILRASAALLSRQELQAFAGLSIDHDDRSAITTAESTLQRLYAEVLGLPITTIGMNDSFVRLGGDSILAIRLVGAARQAGLIFTVRDVLGTRRLEEHARTAVFVSERSSFGAKSAEYDYVPFSLLGSKGEQTRAELVRLAAEQCSVATEDIEDLYPCTPLQEGMVAMSMRQPHMYVGRIVFRIPEDVDHTRIQGAWQATVNANAILRTRIVQGSQGLWQAVVARGQGLTWETTADSPAWTTEPTSLATSYLGVPLVRCTLGKREFALVIHHAVWDAWSMRLIHDEFERAFQGELLRERPFYPFIQYLQGIEGMDEFWRNELADCEAPAFPALPSVHHQPTPTATFQYRIENIERTSRSQTMANYLQLAWAFLIAHYTDSTEAVYGVTVSGRNGPLVGIDELAGPTIATVPMRVSVQPSDCITATLEQIQARGVRMIPYEQAGLQRIARTSADAANACRFQSHLNIQVVDDHADRRFSVVQGTVVSGMDLSRFSSYVLNLLVELSPDNGTVTVNTTYDPKILRAAEVERMIHQWEHLLRQICRSPTGTIQELDLVGPRDWDQIQAWNAVVPSADRRCLHHLVRAQEMRHPERLAVFAWDGQLTYQQLAVLSSRLARRLRLLAVGRGSFVPICLDRSRWSIVAILGVLQAGATCVLLDPQHPRQRMRDIVAGLDAHLFINAPTTATVTKGLGAIELQLSSRLTEQLWGNSVEESSNQMYNNNPNVDPEDLAFVIFTSGSTGQSKGIAMPHRTISTSIRHHSAGMRIDDKTRALHFSSYAFDVSIYEIFTTLAAGGCVCVPSEHERTNQLAEFIQRAAVNWTFLTPSAVQALHPSEVPGLTTLVLGGEAVTQENVDTWATSDRSLINGYGPAEATICAVGSIPEQGWRPGGIGHVVGGIGWVTVPSDPSRLAAVGAIGELLLEGPFLAQGYLHRPEITAASFIDPPEWRRQWTPSRVADASEAAQPHETRLYRTGDLVQYQEDGSIRYIGRRDTQVKLRGQRIDLGGVETQVGRMFPGAGDVAAEAIQLPILSNTILLVAFVHCREGHSTVVEEGPVPVDTIAGFRDAVDQTQSRLQSLLPSYMVPSMFVPVGRMPKTVTGKTDRRRLRQAVLSLSALDLQSYRVMTSRQAIIPVATDAERRLQEIWAQVLRMPREEIGSNDGFTLHGGDSVTAMWMVALARRAHFNFTIADVLNNQPLCDLARNTKQALPSAVTELASSSAVAPSNRLPIHQITAALEQTGLSLIPAEDIAVHPATQAQSFLIQRYPWTHWQFSFSGHVDADLLGTACTRLVAAHSILRALFVKPSAGAAPVQIIPKALDTPFHTVTTPDNIDLDDYCQTLCNADQKLDVLTTVPPARFMLVSNPLRTAQTLILRLSHSQYDGICVPKIVADLEALYNGTVPITATRFERYLDERREYEVSAVAHKFWREYLAGSSPCSVSIFASSSLDSSHSSSSLVSASQTLGYTALPPQVTLATVVKAAACLVLARHAGHTDVVVRQTVNGRSLPLAQIDEMVGPCVSFIPFRATLKADMTVQDYLVHTQTQHTRSLDSENVELDTIIRECTNWGPPTVSRPGFILQHQNIDMDLHLTLAGNRCFSFSSSGRLRPGSEIWICSTPRPAGVEVEVVASERSLTAETARNLTREVVDVMRSLLDDGKRVLGSFDGLNWGV